MADIWDSVPGLKDSTKDAVWSKIQSAPQKDIWASIPDVPREIKAVGAPQKQVEPDRSNFITNNNPSIIAPINEQMKADTTSTAPTTFGEYKTPLQKMEAQDNPLEETSLDFVPGIGIIPRGYKEINYLSDAARLSGETKALSEAEIVSKDEATARGFNQNVEAQSQPITKAIDEKLQDMGHEPEFHKEVPIEKPSPIIKKPRIGEPEPEAITTKADELLAHPRVEELLNMQREVEAKDMRSPQNLVQAGASREVERWGGQEGQAYDKAVYEHNPRYDFELTKNDVKNIEAGKIDEATESKLERDLATLDNHPAWELPKIEDIKPKDMSQSDWEEAQMQFSKEKELTPENKDILFSKAENEATTAEEAQQSAKKLLGKQYDTLKDDINIVQKYEDLPKALRDRAEVFSSGGKIRGIFDPIDNKVHLVADTMHPKEVQAVLVHELLHKSIASGAKPLGQMHDTFILRLKQLKEEPLVAKAFSDAARAGTEAKYINEEMMAYLVQAYHNGVEMSPKLIRYVKDIIERVKVFVSENAVKLGVDAKWMVSKMNEKDIATILKSSAIKQGGKAEVKAIGKQEKFTQAKQILKEVDASGQPKVVQEAIKKAIHKNIIEKGFDKTIQVTVGGAIKLADAATMKIASRSINKFLETDLANNMFTHKINAAKDYMVLREDTLLNMNKAQEAAMKMHNMLKDLSPQAREAMYDYATGDKTVQLTPELKTASDHIIRMVDEKGKSLVDNGILSKEAYADWEGKYLHRRYSSKMKQVKDLFTGAKGFTTDEIKARGKTWKGTSEELAKYENAGIIGKISDGLIEATELPNGKISFRRDWTRDERASMGEIRDIAYSFPETYGRLAMLEEHGKLLKSIPSKYIAENGKFTDMQLKQFGFRKLDGKKYGALNGRWVDKTIADDIHRTATELSGDETLKAYKEFITAVKTSHTVYNTASHFYNTISNIVMQTTAGLNPAKALIYAKQGLTASQEVVRLEALSAKKLSGLTEEETKEVIKLEANKNVQLYLEAKELGLFGKSQLNSILRTYLTPTVEITKAESAITKVSDFAKKAYEAEDNIMRFSAYKQLKEQGFTAKEAVKEVNDNIIPDYSKPMGKYARALRDSGVVPFMSWSYYATPMMLRQMKNNPTRVLAIMGGIYAIDEAFGVNPFDKKEMPQEGYSTKNLVVGREGNKVTTLGVQTMIPQSQFMNPVETVRGMVTGGIPQSAIASIFNIDLYHNRPVTQASGGKAVYQYGKNIVQNVLPTPDTLDKVYNVAESHVLEAKARKSNNVFEPKTPTQQALSFIANTNTYDISKQREKAYNDKLKEKK